MVLVWGCCVLNLKRFFATKKSFLLRLFRVIEALRGEALSGVFYEIQFKFQHVCNKSVESKSASYINTKQNC